MEMRAIQLRTHLRNIDRYRSLLDTKLSELERQFIERRMSEERLAMATLVNTPSHH
jgi:hypothetical protein